tara:strand:+ start:315 stop:1205 length:891 start_codon:yes stop_codon:yes gene_type:complete
MDEAQKAHAFRVFTIECLNNNQFIGNNPIVLKLGYIKSRLNILLNFNNFENGVFKSIHLNCGRATFIGGIPSLSAGGLPNWDEKPHFSITHQSESFKLNFYILPMEADAALQRIQIKCLKFNGGDRRNGQTEIGIYVLPLDMYQNDTYSSMEQNIARQTGNAAINLYALLNPILRDIHNFLSCFSTKLYDCVLIQTRIYRDLDYIRNRSTKADYYERMSNALNEFITDHDLIIYENEVEGTMHRLQDIGKEMAEVLDNSYNINSTNDIERDDIYREKLVSEFSELEQTRTIQCIHI